MSWVIPIGVTEWEPRAGAHAVSDATGFAAASGRPAA
jgi:hypothetical protein